VGATLEGSIASLAYRGRAITVGQAGRDTHRPDLSMLSPGNRSLTGVFLGGELAVNHARAWTTIDLLIRDVAQGELRVVIDRTFPLSEAAAAHAYIESRQAFGRVLLIP
jgi:NADPH2:quinone reductase